MNVARFQVQGYWLTEMEIDLFGTITSYRIDDTRYWLVRTPHGWRAKLAPHGKARRVYRGPGWPNLGQAVAYLQKYSYIPRRTTGDNCRY